MWLASTEKGWSFDRGRDPYMLIRRPKWSPWITTNTRWVSLFKDILKDLRDREIQYLSKL